MKLYIWTRVKCLENYGPGMCFALAESIEEAIELIVTSYTGEWCLPESPFTEKSKELRRELKASEPGVYDSPHGFYKYGTA